MKNNPYAIRGYAILLAFLGMLFVVSRFVLGGRWYVNFVIILATGYVCGCLAKPRPGTMPGGAGLIAFFKGLGLGIVFCLLKNLI